MVQFSSRSFSCISYFKVCARFIGSGKETFLSPTGSFNSKLSCANKSSETKILVGTVSITTVPDKNWPYCFTNWPKISTRYPVIVKYDKKSYSMNYSSCFKVLARSPKLQDSTNSLVMNVDFMSQCFKYVFVDITSFEWHNSTQWRKKIWVRRPICY